MRKAMLGGAGDDASEDDDAEDENRKAVGTMPRAMMTERNSRTRERMDAAGLATTDGAATGAAWPPSPGPSPTRGDGWARGALRHGAVAGFRVACSPHPRLGRRAGGRG